jgi:hypothetical protein
MFRFSISRFLLLLLLFGLAGCISIRAPILVENVQSQYIIQLTRAAGDTEQRAARLLQSTINSMTGVILPIESTDVAPEETVIWIVSAGREKGFPFDIDFSGLERDGFRLERRGRTFIIAGGTDRGAYIGTARLLEQWGCRITTVPGRADDGGGACLHLP